MVVFTACGPATTPPSGPGWVLPEARGRELGLATLVIEADAGISGTVTLDSAPPVSGDVRVAVVWLEHPTRAYVSLDHAATAVAPSALGGALDPTRREPQAVTGAAPVPGPELWWGPEGFPADCGKTPLRWADAVLVVYVDADGNGALTLSDAGALQDRVIGVSSFAWEVLGRENPNHLLRWQDACNGSPPQLVIGTGEAHVTLYDEPRLSLVACRAAREGIEQTACGLSMVQQTVVSAGYLTFDDDALFLELRQHASWGTNTTLTVNGAVKEVRDLGDAYASGLHVGTNEVVVKTGALPEWRAKVTSFPEGPRFVEPPSSVGARETLSLSWTAVKGVSRYDVTVRTGAKSEFSVTAEGTHVDLDLAQKLTGVTPLPQTLVIYLVARDKEDRGAPFTIEARRTLTVKLDP